MWFDLCKHGSLYAKVKSSDYLKLYYNHRLRQCKNNNYYYIFGGFTSSKIYRTVDFRVGLGYISDNCNVENRLKLDFKDSPDVTWYLKAHCVCNKLRLGWMSVLNINRLLLRKNNFLLGY